MTDEEEKEYYGPDEIFEDEEIEEPDWMDEALQREIDKLEAREYHEMQRSGSWSRYYDGT